MPHEQSDHRGGTFPDNDKFNANSTGLSRGVDLRSRVVLGALIDQPS